MKRFVLLFDSVIEFLRSHQEEELGTKINFIRGDVAYLADIYDKINSLNFQLQGCNFTLIQTKNAVNIFISKTKPYKQNLGRKECCQFPSMRTIPHIFTDDGLRTYCAHLLQLYDDFQKRFKDSIDLNIPDWVKIHLSANPKNRKSVYWKQLSSYNVMKKQKRFLKILACAKCGWVAV